VQPAKDLKRAKQNPLLKRKRLLLCSFKELHGLAPSNPEEETLMHGTLALWSTVPTSTKE
jgi:hypothetical protein